VPRRRSRTRRDTGPDTRPTPSDPDPTAVPTPGDATDHLHGAFVHRDNSANIPAEWSLAGFTGAITYAPITPPQYFIGWQSLLAGTNVLCTSGITVQLAAP
jgi:hypothetical protein